MRESERARERERGGTKTVGDNRDNLRVEKPTSIVKTRRVPVQRAVERDEIPYP